jgi:myo-inositol-1(or 4)-monophosphatase
MSELSRLCELVRLAAKEELLPRFRQVSRSFKEDGSLLTEADLAMQHRLEMELKTLWPEYVFLGEEMTSSEQQQLLNNNQNGLWLVDPLDGTSNFSQGIPIFSVSVALIKNNNLQLGVVYDPVRDECFSAKQGEGAFLNDKSLSLESEKDTNTALTGLVDFKRLATMLAQKLVSEPPYKSQRSFGSVALDWCWIAAGRGQVYVHGKQNLWDYAAGYLILQEAGGYSSTLEGEPVFNGGLLPRSAVAAVSKPLFDDWLTFLRSA